MDPTTSTPMLDHLQAIGGQLWERDTMRRVYFNGLAGWLGLKTTHYKTGNVSSARLHREKISNSQARKIMSALLDAKVYFDLADGKFHGRGISNGRFQQVVSAIREALADVETDAVDVGE